MTRCRHQLTARVVLCTMSSVRTSYVLNARDSFSGRVKSFCVPHSNHTCPGAHPAFYLTVLKAVSPYVKYMWREGYHQRLSGDEVTNTCRGVPSTRELDVRLACQVGWATNSNSTGLSDVRNRIGETKKRLFLP